MDATVETNHHLATFSHPKLDPREHFNNFGLGFTHVFSHLSNPQNVPPDALNSDSHRFGHTDVLRPGDDDQSPRLATLPGRSHEPQRGRRLIFLCGYQSLGPSSSPSSIYNIKPEFWRRHFALNFAASPSQFEDIKLPSAICDIFQLRIWTIGYRGNGARSDQGSVDVLRRDSAKLMEDYRERWTTRSSFRDDDSVVRKYEVPDQEFFSIEQLVTIHVSTSTAHENDKDAKNDSWLAVVNSDCGRDLHESPKGPWLGDHLAYNATYYTSFFPVPDHRSRVDSFDKDLTQRYSRAEPRSRLKALPQSLAGLPEAHRNGSRDEELMQKDPLYALNGIFSFFVASEAQMLSFLARQIEPNTAPKVDAVEVVDTESLSNLLHCRQLLEGHGEELRYVLGIIQRRGGERWPRARSDISEKAASSLQADLEYLVERAVVLRSRSETSITLAMNVASIGETRPGLHQNKAMFRFTVLVSIYVPFSFTASFFGMNFQQFGQGDLSIWIYVVVSVPVFALSILFLFPDLGTFSSMIRRTRSRN